MLLSYGIFGWDSRERRTLRYGGANTYDVGSDGNNYGSFHHRESDAEKELRGRRVRLFAEVTEARDSSHVGDYHLKIRPTKPEVGEVVELGVGRLGIGEHDFLLHPEDGRDVLWMDPRKLFRLVDQTVLLCAEETDAPYSTPPDIEVDRSPAAYHLGDGGIQYANIPTGVLVSLPPEFERLGKGTFLPTWPKREVGTRANVAVRDVPCELCELPQHMAPAFWCAVTNHPAFRQRVEVARWDARSARDERTLDLCDRALSGAPMTVLTAAAIERWLGTV
jgi:hypothetical protein